MNSGELFQDSAIIYNFGQLVKLVKQQKAEKKLQNSPETHIDLPFLWENQLMNVTPDRIKFIIKFSPYKLFLKRHTSIGFL